MFRGAVALTGALTVTIFIAACGESEESERLPAGVSTLAAEETTTAPGGGDAWKRYEGKNFTVELPVSWVAVGTSEDALATDAFEDMPAEAREALQSGDFFYALDGSEEARKRRADGELAGSFSIGQLALQTASWSGFVEANSTPPDGAENFRTSVVTPPAGQALMLTFNRTGAPLQPAGLGDPVCALAPAGSRHRPNDGDGPRPRRPGTERARRDGAALPLHTISESQSEP